MTLSARIDALITALWNAKGTDLLLTAGVPPTIRVGGMLYPVVGEQPLTADDTAAMIDEILTDKQRAARGELHEYDFSFSWLDRARIRGNVYIQKDNTAIALRLIPRNIPTMEQLGLPPIIGTFTEMHQGLVLVTGPTGSGKSTSLAAAIARINATRPCHIITIEDPIEYLHEHNRAVVSQRQVGQDTASFPDALRSALREDPDVLLVGEMRDLESIAFALTIAETGHLVFATLHTNDTSQALDRIIDVFPAERQAQVRVQLASVLTGVVYQRLVPRIGGGQVAAFEVMVANSAIRNLVKEGKTNQLRNALVTGHRDGMVTFEQSLTNLIRAGSITYDDALARSLYPKDLEQMAHPALMEASPQ